MDCVHMRGGKREGSGRKPSPNPRKPICFRLNESEHIAVKSLLEAIRKNNINKDEKSIDLINSK